MTHVCLCNNSRKNSHFIVWNVSLDCELLKDDPSFKGCTSFPKFNRSSKLLFIFKYFSKLSFSMLCVNKMFCYFFLHLPSWTIMRKLSPQIWIRYLSISIEILLQFDWNMHVLTLTFVFWPLFYFICTFFHVNFEVIKVAILQEFDQNKSDNCLTSGTGDVFEKQCLL